MAAEMVVVIFGTKDRLICDRFFRETAAKMQSLLLIPPRMKSDLRKKPLLDKIDESYIVILLICA